MNPVLARLTSAVEIGENPLGSFLQSPPPNNSNTDKVSSVIGYDLEVLWQPYQNPATDKPGLLPRDETGHQR